MPHRFKDDVFDGLILVATNNSKDNINRCRYEQLAGDEITFKTVRHGQQRQEWNDIPDSISLKIGCRVMVIRNLYDAANGHRLLQANGDLGIVVDMRSGSVTVKRNDGQIIEVQMLTVDNADREITYSRKGRRRSKRKEKPTGSVTYMLLQLAWASTIHKCQGLTIEGPVQLNLYRDNEQLRQKGTFWKPGMIYVAASRVKNPAHLQLAGASSKEWGISVEEYCRMHKECEPWL